MVKRVIISNKEDIYQNTYLNLLQCPMVSLTGVGDSGDHWKVVCSDDVWLRSNAVKFQHVDTDVYLSVSGRTFGR